MNKILTVKYLLRYQGLKWLMYRLCYYAQTRLGFIKHKLPVSTWDSQPLKRFLKDPSLAESSAYFCYRYEKSPVFFFSPAKGKERASFFRRWDTEEQNPVAESDLLENGEFYFFSHIKANVGFPPKWHINPFSGQHSPLDSHWSRVDDFAFGDIKIIWEVNRFGFVYALVRSYWRTGDEKYARVFWQLIENWRMYNPPQQGVNWKCGQEISIRVMAWCFGLYGFLYSKYTTPEQLASLAQIIAVSGHRIESNLSYALSQDNNHGISEAMGLWTIGILFPEFRSSARWKNLGRQVLESLAQKLIYNDGSFVQHSVNYHRLMLHNYLWSIRLGDLNKEVLNPNLKERFRRAVDFLYQIQDTKTGKAPNYGQNDGAYILPLCNCEFWDFRPVIQAAYYLILGKRCFADGPWDEQLFWMFGSESCNATFASCKKINLKAKDGGYYTIRSDKGFLFTRCATFRHRPSQADMLHLDLWWQGENIAQDPGTYSYNDRAPWNNPFARTIYHNTVTVDDKDQMRRAGKFLWLPWICARVNYYQQSESKNLTYFEGEHNGYHQLKDPVSYRRSILQFNDDKWLILDALKSRSIHRYRLHWLFPDVTYNWDDNLRCLNLKTKGGDYFITMSTGSGKGKYSIVRADETSPRGWRASYYNYREAALSMDLIAKADNLFFWSLFSPDKCIVENGENILQIVGSSWNICVKLQNEAHKPLVKSALLKGKVDDNMVIS